VRPVEAYSRLAEVYDAIVVDPCHGRWASFLDERWSDDPAGVRSVLDLCCGTGLLAAALVERGYRVVGVDASEAMLAVARTRLGAAAELRRATLPDHGVDDVVDAVVCTFDGLNYLTPATLRLTLTAAARVLRPNGWLVFDLHTDAMLDFTLANPVAAGRSDGNDFVIRSVVDPDARTCETTIELTRADGDSFQERHRQYFHPDAAVRADLHAAGFAVAGVSEEYTDRPADASTLRATWTARRLPAAAPLDRNEREPPTADRPDGRPADQAATS
jgi:predicted TPR repeat methyltransferase